MKESNNMTKDFEIKLLNEESSNTLKKEKNHGLEEDSWENEEDKQQ